MNDTMYKIHQFAVLQLESFSCPVKAAAPIVRMPTQFAQEISSAVK
jgi:hypothetical protein